MKSTIFIASDHAGITLKNQVLRYVKERGDEIIDLGPENTDSVDYPDYAKKLCEKLLKEGGLGILICGSGMGMSMAANRFKGIRAALCHNVEAARLSRQHNDANVLCLGARLVDENININIVEAFLESTFEGGRHAKRVEKMG